MQLKVLQDIGEIKGKKIICFGKSELYMNEMIYKFHVADIIEMVLDNNPKIYGEMKINDRSVMICSPDVLRQIDLQGKVIVITSSFYDEIYRQLCSIEQVMENMSVIYHYNDYQLELEQFYSKKYKQIELENKIIFRSGPKEDSYVKGTDFADNARALFEYMVEHHYYHKYKLVWFVKNPSEYQKKYPIKNVEFISFDWASSKKEEEADEYYRNLLSAKFIFFTDSYGFAKCVRKDQIRVQLWHGCGFKTRVNFARCENRYEYTTVVSDLYSEIHQKIYGLRKNQMLVTGYAKQDWIFQPYEKSLSDLLEIKKASKYIFWLPTFRMADDKLKELNQYEWNPDTGLPIISNEKQLKQLNELLKTYDTFLIIKLHPFQKRDLIKNCDCSNIKLLENSEMLEKDLVINRILASADALISDYSSVAIDFLNVDRPIAFTLDDKEDYKNSRGFVFENIVEWLPGKEIYNFNDFCNYVVEIAEGIDSAKEKRRELTSKFLNYTDNQNCKRIVEALSIGVK